VPPASGARVRTGSQVGPVLAGMPGRGEPVEVGDPSRSDADELLEAAGLAAGEIAELRSEGVVA